MLLVVGAWSALHASGPSARSVLWRLPTTIFENTPEGLSENEKYELLVQGATEHWAICTSSPDMLELKALPDGDSSVLLRLFRGEGYTVAAIGTDTGPVCSIELWRLDVKGGAEPMDVPDEPDILDFFAPGTRIPPDVTASLPFCVRPDGLEVRPLFWTSIGLAHVMVDNAVFYLWTGTRFSKRVVRLPRPPSPSARPPASQPESPTPAQPSVQPPVTPSGEPDSFDAPRAAAVTDGLAGGEDDEDRILPVSLD